MYAPIPPFCAPGDVDTALIHRGHAVTDRAGLCHLADVEPEALEALAPFWDDLPADAWLRDGGRYRRRRHGSFLVDGDEVVQAPHRAHWQPLDYNALHGGMHRWFAPLDPAMVAMPAWTRLLRTVASRASALRGQQPWFVEAHAFRIDTTGGIGRPTPEGAHRDGVDLVSVSLVRRASVKGGETRVFDVAGPNGTRFLLTRPWTTLFLDDARVMHETTPIQPVGEDGHRDTLVVTCRAGGFLAP